MRVLILLLTLFSFSALADYSKIANNGNVLAADAVLGSGNTDWACTRDNATGLVWEVKTTSGLRSQDITYTNYDDVTQAEVYTGSGYRQPTQAEIDAASNSIGFVNAVNTSALCGFRDWKMPSKDELLALYPKINANTAFFPNSATDFFWSGTADGAGAWGVYFSNGGYLSGNRSSHVHVRLVRSGQLTLSASGTGSGGIASSVGGLSCTSTAGTTSGTCTTSLSEGTSVDLTATPATGSSFTGWSGACSGTTSPCTVIVAALKSVTANFALNSYSVTFVANGGSAVSSQSIVYNGTATAPTAPTQTGYLFGGWYTDSGLSTAFVFSTAITADTTLYAQWTPAYSKIANDGSELPDSAAFGSEAADWACTRDNATGLVWEVKTTSGTRNQSTNYTNYDDVTQAEFNGGTRNPTQAEIDAASNSIGFVNAVNSSALCGFRDWKMPSKDELLALYPKINANTTFFPNSLSAWFWSGTPYASDPAFAWVVFFDVGGSYPFGQRFAFPVRLVRSAPSSGTFALTLSASGTGTGGIVSSVGGLSCTSTAGTTSGTCTTSLSGETSVDLTATAAAGSSFTSWSGACSGTTSPCTVIMAALKSVTAGFSVLPNYTVTFSPNGGTGTMSAQSTNVATNLTANSFSKAGYTFNNWNTAANGTGTAYANSASYAFTVNVTLYAQWTALANKSVTFNANSGTGTMSAQSTNVATNLTANSFTRSGYTFNNWNTAANGTGTAYANSASYAFTVNVTLYAQWAALPITPDTYSVIYSGNGSTGGNVPIDGNTYAQGSSVTVLGSGSLSKTGSTFAGWNTAANGNGAAYAAAASFSMGSTAVTLYAKWTVNSYTVSFNSNGGSAVTSQTVAYNGTATAPTAPTQTGSTFAGWYADSGLAALFVFSTPISVNRTLYAKWTGNNYSITAIVSPTAGGTVMCSPNPANYNASSTCTATPATGYAFTGWSGDCSGIMISTCTLSQVMANKSVTGNFKATSVVILSAAPAAQALSGQTTTLTAQVSGVAGVPGGSISFLDGANLLGSATLDGSGGAVFASNLPIGTYSLLARYAGNTAYLAEQSLTLSYLVASKLPTTLRISTTPNLSQIGQSVTVHVTASAVQPANPGAGEVTGMVQVSGDGQTCSLTLPASSCALTEVAPYSWTDFRFS